MEEAAVQWGRARQTGGMTVDVLHLTAAIPHEGKWYVARCLQVEVTSQGENIEESLGRSLREALELYFEDAPVPEVTDADPGSRRQVVRSPGTRPPGPDGSRVPQLCRAHRAP